tara:strand:+ start:176 stop:832 length:657 start_codon:yes stop_codon:yes gene_type:complete
MSCNWKAHTKRTFGFSSSCHLKHGSKKHSKVSFAFIIVLLLFIKFSFSQTRITKKWDSDLFTYVVFKIPYSNKINIVNTTNPEVEVSFNSNGEYSNSIILGTKIINKTLLIEEIINPSFKIKEDKLSIHKVISSSLLIKIPKFLEFKTEIEDAKVYFEGLFKFIKVSQKNGEIFLKIQSSHGEIFTQFANIYIFNNYIKTLPRLQVESENGTIFYDYQ